jgi:uncharacterized protein
MTPIIPKLKKLVKTACYQPSNIYGSGAWDFHIQKVVYFSLKMAKILKADKEIVQISALLHDYAAVKNKKYCVDHELYGAKFAQKILKKYNYPQNKIDIVKNCILAHRGSRLKAKTSPEEICIADADAMAHFLAIGSLFYLCFNTHKLGIKDSGTWILQKLERSWQKLSPQAKKLIKPHYLAAKLLFGKP